MQKIFILQQVVQIVATTVWRLIERVGMCVCVCARACLCVCVYVCMYATYVRMIE